MSIMPDTSRTGAFRDTVVQKLSNWLLNHVATGWYRAMISGSIQLGLEAAKSDNEQKAIAWDRGWDAGNFHAIDDFHRDHKSTNPYRVNENKEE